jgi:aminopeptidase-like protein
LHPLSRLLSELEEERLGEAVHGFAREAYPICRSITGDGVRRTLEILRRWLPLEVHEVPTGTEVFDWTVPREWNVREAWIADASGRRIVDFADHNLHLLNYSTPFAGRLSLEELRPHLFSDPERPEVIPYRTSYFKERWGFCLPHRLLETLEQGEYEVLVDTRLEEGSLTYGEFFLPGELPETVHLSAHICHPSLANDNLSALGVLAALGKLLAGLAEEGVKLRYSYRLLFAPGTIGAITWLARNREAASRIAHGLVAANLGDGGAFHYKKSRRGDAEIDRAAAQVLEDSGEPFVIEEFLPFGYDERQYGSPGFDLAVGSLTRTPWGRYPEYHGSRDDLDFIRPEHLGRSLRRYLEVLSVLEQNRTYRNLNPHCEPQLGRRGLYNLLGGRDDGRERELAILWVLNQSDGANSLLDICERANLSFARVLDAVEALLEVDLLEEVESL